MEDLIRSSSRTLVIGVGGGGDVVGALAAARFLEFCGIECVLGGLSWERSVFDPIPGPRSLAEVENVRPLHRYAWMANPNSRTLTGVYFAEAKMAAFCGREVLLFDINGGVSGVVDALETAIGEFRTDLLLGLDVGGDSLATGVESGLRSPLADSVLLAAFAELEARRRRALWAVFGYGSDGELKMDEIELAIAAVAKARGLLGAWSLTPRIAAELEEAVKTVPTEASAIPLECFRGAWGERRIRTDQRSVRLTPLAALIFFMTPSSVYAALSRPAQAVRRSRSLEEANDALHAIGIRTELDLERERYDAG
ncbi:MAG TPA: DUF1152 domain-containing protein [Candidatus Eisenbacteria bacterium]|nr:DUF1152 domain-containing protein [Candidatus Eisenbacteria bacterium]